MIDWLIEIDKQLFLFLNGLHTTWLDPVMFFISGRKEWIPLYAFLVYLLVRNYRWQSLYYIAGIALAVLLADQFTSGFMKPFFERLRPSHDPEIGPLTHIVNDYRGGSFGFASSHAANTFAVATWFFLVFRTKYKTITWMFLWSSVVSYSRIYLGVHYPSDILVGAVVGTVMALGVYWVIRKVKKDLWKGVFG